MTQALDYPTDDDDVTAHREGAKAELDQIARETRLALADQCIDLDLFFLAPNSGDAVLIFGTPGGPDDASWERVGEVVAAIVAQSIGLERPQCRSLRCATTHAAPIT